MSLSYDDMMFECVFDNTKTINKSKNKKTKKKTDKNIFFEYNMNENINFDSIKKLYSNYEFINKDYSLIIDIIKETNNDSLFTLKKDSNRSNFVNADSNSKKLQIKQFINQK